MVEECPVYLFGNDGRVARFVVLSLSYVASVRASPAEHDDNEHNVAFLNVPPSARS